MFALGGKKMLRYFQGPRLSQKAIENREEDLKRVQGERALGDGLSAFLFVLGLLTILFFTIQTVNEYFGERELFEELENGSAASGANTSGATGSEGGEATGFDGDEFYALMNFLRDLLEGWALGGILIGASWLVARSLLRWIRDDEYVSVGTGQEEAMDARVARNQDGAVGSADGAKGSPGYRGREATRGTGATR
jgi:hypothetical protein